MRVVIIEVDHTLGVLLQKALIEDGHDVELAGDGDSGLALAARKEPDLMILDLSLPRRDGSEVLKVLRRDMPNVSVLVVTSRREECVRCLDAGADDFLIKPFHPDELMSRCRAILRRRLRFLGPRLCFGAVELNQVDHTITYTGVSIALAPQDCKLLEFMVQKQGKQIRRSDLLTRVGLEKPGSRLLLVPGKLSPTSGVARAGDSAIVTVRGVGYRVQCMCQSSRPCLIHGPRPAAQPARRA